MIAPRLRCFDCTHMKKASHRELHHSSSHMKSIDRYPYITLHFALSYKTDDTLREVWFWYISHSEHEWPVWIIQRIGQPLKNSFMLIEWDVVLSGFVRHCSDKNAKCLYQGPLNADLRRRTCWDPHASGDLKELDTAKLTLVFLAVLCHAHSFT